MKVPKRLTHFTLFINGRDKAGTIKTINLPELSEVEEDYKSGGMDTPIPVDTAGTEALVAEFVLSDYDPQVLGLFGKYAELEARGVQKFQSGISAVVVKMNGKVSKSTPGPWEAGNAEVGMTIRVKCTYYMLEIDGKTYHEIDPINMKRIIDGEDMLALARAILLR